MSNTLNRKKPYGEIWGANTNARFHQDGKYFDAAGEQVVMEGAPAPDEAKTPPTASGPSDAERSAADAALAQRQAALQMQAFKVLNLSVEKVASEVEDASDEMLPVLRAVEVEVKNRAPVLAAIDAEVQARADKAAAAAGQTSQVDTQLQA